MILKNINRFKIIYILYSIFNKVKNILKLPVNYSNYDFTLMKRKIDWNNIENDRINAINGIFDTDKDEIHKYVEEAMKISIENENNIGHYNGLGSPMGRTDRITLYCLVRIFKPKICIETGTAAGASSIYILSAMELNNVGLLFSIDFSDNKYKIGNLIPNELRHRLQLFYGDSLSIIPDLTSKYTHIDLFLHDSKHTYHHMMAEYKLANNALSPIGVLCSHDVLFTNAWEHFVKRYKIQKSAIVKNFGFALIENNKKEIDV